MKHASKYNDWKDIYNWETCKTNRKAYGEFLCSFLTNTDDSLVVNMNGSWGTGKTELLRRLYVELAERKHAVVYIDAWESDFSNDPLAVVCSEFLTQLGNIFQDNENETKQQIFAKAKDTLVLLKVGLSTCLKLGQGYGLATGDAVKVAAFKGADTALDAASNAISATAVNKDQSIAASNIELVEKVQQNHLARISAMKEIKKHITFLAELMHEIYGLNKQVVVLVDELDRCRPTYAIEMLEVIKHFFETKGCVFLVATDTDALQHSISAIYGSQFNAEAYLKRFFNRKIKLSEISELDYLRCKNLDFDKYEEKGILLYPFKGSLEKNIEFFAELFAVKDFKLRDIEQALQQFFASLDFITMAAQDQKTIINVVVLMTGIVENILRLECFENRKSNASVPHERTVYKKKFVEYHLYDYINTELSLTTNTMSTEVHSGDGGSRIFGNPVECLSIQSSNFAKDTDRRKILEIQEVITLSEHGQHKYWLWGDYKKIIELSGHIE